jgi:hypothetical protein
MFHLSLFWRDFISSADSILAVSVAAVVRCADALRVLDIVGFFTGGKNEVTRFNLRRPELV